MNKNLITLWKQLLQLAEIATDKAVLIVEDTLAEGVEVFVEKEGEYVAPEDGEYEAEDKIIVIADGKVAEIRAKEEPEPEEKEEEIVVEEEAAEEEVVVEEPAQPEPDERDARIAELEAENAELEAEKAALEARVAELEAQLAEKQAQLEMSSEEPAKEKVKKESKTGALRYFN